MTKEEQFQAKRDKIRRRLLKYTGEAFRMLPQMDKPRILDIGCGSGIPTLELARLSQEEVIGIDIDQPALDQFTRKIKGARLTEQVKAVNCSMFDMDFADESFDIIWSEGSIYAIGFERGLMEWKQFLKLDGFMVIHDEQGDIKEKLDQISNRGYELLGYFVLSKETWWTEYFAPLERLISESPIKYTHDPKIPEEIQQAQEELDWFKKNPQQSNSVYFVMRRK
ncbi:class I SAM-dependent methyltransferase [Chloroflexota bacterium]